MFRPTFVAPILAALLLTGCVQPAQVVTIVVTATPAAAPVATPTSSRSLATLYAEAGAKLTDDLNAARDALFDTSKGETWDLARVKLVPVRAVLREMRALRVPPGLEQAHRTWGLMVDSYDAWSNEEDTFMRLMGSGGGLSSANQAVDASKRAAAFYDQGLKYENQWRDATHAPAPAKTATPVVTPAPAVKTMPLGTTATLDLNGRDEVPLADQLKDLLAYGPASSSERAWAVSTRKVILVPKGAVVTVLEIQGDYAHVRVQDGPWRNSDGWVDRRAVPSVGQ